MDLLEAIQARHSVRHYLDKPIALSTVNVLRQEIEKLNRESGLHIGLALEEPGAFRNPLAHYGMFRGVRNYFTIACKKSEDLDEQIGYYGEQLVLLAQTLGLNTCWVALTYSKRRVKAELAPGETVRIVIALGYGETQGTPHRSRALDAVCRTDGTMPDWFRRGVEAALLAPTAVNQQKFRFTLAGSSVHAEALPGPCSQIDLGIVKCHFEIAAGMDNFSWK
ncbi:MAG: nitroreductase [Butyricicoccus sp.]|nr:nitroreductase [Butyricicoccus sp.]